VGVLAKRKLVDVAEIKRKKNKMDREVKFKLLYHYAI